MPKLSKHEIDLRDHNIERICNAVKAAIPEGTEDPRNVVAALMILLNAAASSIGMTMSGTVTAYKGVVKIMDKAHRAARKTMEKVRKAAEAAPPPPPVQGPEVLYDAMAPKAPKASA